MDFKELGGMRQQDNLNIKIRRVEQILQEQSKVNLDLALL